MLELQRRNRWQLGEHGRYICSLLLVCAACLVWHTGAYAMQVAIVMSSDAHTDRDLVKRIRTNASALVKGRDKLHYRVIDGKNSAPYIIQQLKRLQADKHTDIIVATGFVASQQLANLKTYKKPSIAGIIVDERLQRMPQPLMGRSGIHNFTYVKSAINISSDLRLFARVYPYKKLGIVIDSSLRSQRALIDESFRGFTSAPFELMFVDAKNYASVIKTHRHDVDALYVLPLFSFSDARLQRFFIHINELKLPSFAMAGRSYTEAGALASQSSSDYPEIQARRIALDIMKIVEGQNAASLPIVLPRVDSDFVINEQTANTLGVYPDFRVLQVADVINQLDASSSAKRISVYDALNQALSDNLNIQKIKKDIALSQTDIDEAKRAFLPSLNLRFVGNKVDNAFRNVRGAGITNTVSAQASQVLFSDQALALYKARKLSLDANVEALKRTEYQVVFDVLSGYVQHFNAKRQAAIQRENTQLTRKNLEVARRKASAGYAGKIDVHRLESELAINQANLNQALANYRKTEYALKKLLDIEMNAQVSFEEIAHPLRLLSINDKRLFNDLNNQKNLALFTDYLLDIAVRERPAIVQYKHNIEAQKTLAAAERRKWFMPVVSVAANANKIVGRHEKTGRSATQMQSEWSVSLVADIPIFERLHASDVQRTALTIEKLELERDDLVKSINQGLRSDMQTAIASYTQMQLYKTSAKAAKKNFDIVAKYYQHGRATITDLIDAQNSVLTASLNAVNAEQQFFVDYLKVEQDSGFYYFLADKDQKAGFVDGFLDFAQQQSP